MDRSEVAATKPFWQRHALLAVMLSPLAANIVGSIFNILYNTWQIQPLLTEDQMQRFLGCVLLLNAVVYPIAVAGFFYPLWRLRDSHRRLIRGELVPTETLSSDRRRVINLPWWFLGVASLGWFSCVPTFPAVIAASPDPLRSEVVPHLITSFLIASLIAVTHSFFAVELTVQKTLFPIYFENDSPTDVPGGLPIGITTRGVLWTVSAVVAPVVSLTLLILIPDAAGDGPLFAVGVALVAIVFGLTSSVLLGRLVASPVRALSLAAADVDAGRLDTRIDLKRADEFGSLIDRFNEMVDGLQQKERLDQVFGRHVGREAAKQILAEDEDVAGRSRQISVMFVDVRNFTRHSSTKTPAEVVHSLNVFFERAVETVESHGGMVNKFLGDGFMALFGVTPSDRRHADQAVAAGRTLLDVVRHDAATFAESGWPGLAIGVGVHSGEAVVGSIGSPARQEYTAIGDTVNVASRVESLTKGVDQPMLVTEDTKRMCDDPWNWVAMPSQTVKGKEAPLVVWGVQAGAPVQPDVADDRETAADASKTTR